MSNEQEAVEAAEVKVCRTVVLWFTGICQYSHKAKYHIVVGAGNMEEHGWVKLGEQEVEFTVPADFNPLGAGVKVLRDQQQAVRAAATAKVTELEGEIQNLLALGFDGISKEENDIPF